MIKKVLIASGFLIGGYFLIKKVLPSISKSNELKLDLGKGETSDEVFEKEKRESEKKQMELQNKITMTGLHNLMYFGNRPTR